MAQCEVCTEGLAKYTCPACGARTCSLACVKEHKEKSKCSGIRAKTDFIPVTKMSDETLERDVSLLEEIRGTLSATQPKSIYSVSLACKKRIKEAKVKVRWLPGHFERAKANGTKLVEGQVCWQIERRSSGHDFDPEKPATWHTKGSFETLLESALLPKCYLLEEPDGSARRLRAIKEGTPLRDALEGAEIIEFPTLFFTV